MFGDISVKVNVQNIDNNDTDLMALKARVVDSVNKFKKKKEIDTMSLFVSAGKGAEPSSEKRENVRLYSPSVPLYQLDDLVFSKEVMNSFMIALARISEYEHLYKQWGLEEIERNPRSAINLFGPPGTGKTAAAHALANQLKKKIIVASYADIESKYHGDGPKNVQYLFKSALEYDAVLFIDEADSLLSKRLSSVTQGTEQAINSMRSQLLINMEQHRGLIVFATNFAENYDAAFDSRLIHINIPLPNYEQRMKIVEKHLPSRLPLSEGFSVDKISRVEGVCGRDIKNSIISAAVQARLNNLNYVSDESVVYFINDILDKREKIKKSKEEIELSDKDIDMVEGKLKEHFSEADKV